MLTFAGKDAATAADNDELEEAKDELLVGPSETNDTNNDDLSETSRNATSHMSTAVMSFGGWGRGTVRRRVMDVMMFGMDGMLRPHLHCATSETASMTWPPATMGIRVSGANHQPRQS